MKKIVLLSLVLITILACSISSPSDSFDDKTATQVAVALTATALNQEIKQQGPEVISTDAEGEPSATTTNTPVPPDDPKQELGQPTWSDDLSTGQYWSLDTGDITIDTTTFSVGSGKLSVNAAVIGNGNIWWLTYFTFQDAYLEATFDVSECATDDQYGLVVRAPDYESGFAYYFHITCDGHYDLRRWSKDGSSMLLGMPFSEKIHKGPNQTNTLGVWAKGPIIRLYVNNNLLEEINDSTLINNGHFGLFINARQTPGFTIKMDEISYWTLN
jgi:hypothetical protein